MDNSRIAYVKRRAQIDSIGGFIALMVCLAGLFLNVGYAWYFIILGAVVFILMVYGLFTLWVIWNESS